MGTVAAALSKKSDLHLFTLNCSNAYSTQYIHKMQTKWCEAILIRKSFNIEGNETMNVVRYCQVLNEEPFPAISQKIKI